MNRVQSNILPLSFTKQESSWLLNLLHAPGQPPSMMLGEEAMESWQDFWALGKDLKGNTVAKSRFMA